MGAPRSSNPLKANMATLSQSNFETIARLLGMHRGSSAQQVARLVLVGGLSTKAAAQQVSLGEISAYQAVQRARRVIRDIEDITGVPAAKWRSQ